MQATITNVMQVKTSELLGRGADEAPSLVEDLLAVDGCWGNESNFLVLFTVYGCFNCMYVCVPSVCAWFLWRPEEGIESPETRITDSWELPCRCWELNLGPLEEQQPVLLIAESSLQP